MTSIELQAKIPVWRQKAIEGTLTEEECTQAIAALRGERKAAATKTTAARTKAAKAAVPSADDLLKELGIEGDE